MLKSLRLEISTQDRVGMALDIINQVAKKEKNISAMEVFPNKVYIKIDNVEESFKKELYEELFLLQGVNEIKENKLIPYEENERKIFAFINSVNEGILAVNESLKIEIFNSYCERIFNIPKKDLIGRRLNEFFPEDAPLFEIIKNGESYDNLEIKIETNGRSIHYLTSGRAIKDDNGNILGAVASIRDIKDVKQMANLVSPKEDAFKGIIGNSSEIERVKTIIKMIAKGNSTVLLRGESGCGKELFAKAIHNISNRKDNNIITVNCAALPDNLLESELFGYEEGTFTGALKGGRDGLFKEAHKGTIFLDEIGELSMLLQAKLLRVLQEGTIRKIGSSKEEYVDVRIIAATNKNLEEMMKENKFRDDLYYRLNVIPVFIPSLKKRKEDIPMLVQYFINKLNSKIGKNIEGFEKTFVDELIKYDWPGNVRELENAIERAMNLCAGNLLRLENLMMDFNEDKVLIKEELYNEVQLKLSDVVGKVECDYIINTMSKYKTIRKSAQYLGISHTALINKIKKYNIQW